MLSEHKIYSLDHPPGFHVVLTSCCQGWNHETSLKRNSQSRWLLLFIGGGEGHPALPVLCHILVVLVLNLSFCHMLFRQCLWFILTWVVFHVIQSLIYEVSWRVLQCTIIWVRYTRYHCYYCGKCFGLHNSLQWHVMYNHLASLHYHCNNCGFFLGPIAGFNDTQCTIIWLHYTNIGITVNFFFSLLLVFNKTQCIIIYIW